MEAQLLSEDSSVDESHSEDETPLAEDLAMRRHVVFHGIHSMEQIAKIGHNKPAEESAMSCSASMGKNLNRRRLSNALRMSDGRLFVFEGGELKRFDDNQTNQCITLTQTNLCLLTSYG